MIYNLMNLDQFKHRDYKTLFCNAMLVSGQYESHTVRLQAAWLEFKNTINYTS